eukprot:TRINITY_DN42284_c0_g1_i3.p1 TRINITY_DN42284_c0_g1~~TRINITY_DN42284_c0_g1_i3.p1  ORF type:complete len:269 (-),score=44.00 TRINITY_DN42284_c0_g1_i3:198-929(-)
MPPASAAAKKKALVFGGTSGIGLATCLRLRDRGVAVVAVSRSGVPKPEVGQDVAGIDFARCDVTKLAAVEQLFAEQGQVDIIVSTATGGQRAMGPFLQMDMAGFQGSFAKLWGYANVLRIGGHYVRPGGCIVLVSGAPARRPFPGQVALASVGAAVEQLGRTVAPELAERSVRINVVSPGFIATPMFGSVAEREAKLGAAAKANLISRPGTADEVASAIVFAVENGFVTGTTIDVDGGWLSRL